MDTLLSQTTTVNEAPAYSPVFFKADFSNIKEIVLGQPPDKAFPLFSALDDDRSSPESAALLLKVLHGLRAQLRHSGTWSHSLAPDFETITDQALDFLFESFHETESGGGWGIFDDARPQLYFTVVAIQALVSISGSEQVSKEKKEKIKDLLLKAHKYLRICQDNNRIFKDHERIQAQDAYSAYGLLGLLALWDYDMLSVEFPKEALPIFRYYSDKLKVDTEAAIYYEAESGQRFQDLSSPWCWVLAIMLWLDRRAEFFNERW